MKSPVICLVCSLISLTVFAQEEYGFGYVAAYTDLGDGRVSRTIFITEVVNLDSLSGLKKINLRSSRYRLRLYQESLKKWTLHLINEQHTAMILGKDLEVMNQVELHPDPGPLSKNVERINKQEGYKRDLVFLMKIQAGRLRVRKIKQARMDTFTEIILLDAKN